MAGPVWRNCSLNFAREAWAPFRFAKVHPAEISKECLESLGFSAAGVHLLYAARRRGPIDQAAEDAGA